MTLLINNNRKKKNNCMLQTGKNHHPRTNKEIEFSNKNQFKDNEIINNDYNCSSIIGFRQWKKSDCINKKQLNNIKNINKNNMENFPLSISDTKMMDVDVSLKYLALVSCKNKKIK